jgi:hypothetical protein
VFERGARELTAKRVCLHDARQANVQRDTAHAVHHRVHDSAPYHESINIATRHTVVYRFNNYVALTTAVYAATWYIKDGM